MLAYLRKTGAFIVKVVMLPIAGLLTGLLAIDRALAGDDDGDCAGCSEAERPEDACAACRAAIPTCTCRGCAEIAHALCAACDEPACLVHWDEGFQLCTECLDEARPSVATDIKAALASKKEVVVIDRPIFFRVPVNPQNN